MIEQDKKNPSEVNEVVHFRRVQLFFLMNDPLSKFQKALSDRGKLMIFFCDRAHRVDWRAFERDQANLFFGKTGHDPGAGCVSIRLCQKIHPRRAVIREDDTFALGDR